VGEEKKWDWSDAGGTGTTGSDKSSKIGMVEWQQGLVRAQNAAK